MNKLVKKKKDKFGKQDSECNSWDDKNKSQAQAKKGECSTKSMSSDSTGRSQEQWRGSANEDGNRGQDSRTSGMGTQQKKQSPLQTQRNFSTVSRPVVGASVRYASEDLNQGMNQKNKFEKKDSECDSCDDNNKSQTQEKNNEFSTKSSLSSDSTGSSQEQWRGSANAGKQGQDKNTDKGTGFSEAGQRSEAKDKAQNKESRMS